MFRIKVSSGFSAAHSLQGYQGDCCNLHGHNWKVMITIQCSGQDSLGLAIDFRKAKELLHSVLAEFDHQHLNSLDCFSEINPTSEELAKCIFKRLKPLLTDVGGNLQEVELWESENASVVYSE